MSSEKQKLLELEKTGQYVFHGSSAEIETFELRQAHSYIDGKNVPDGEPAIFASSAVDYAIFMAIINEKNCPRGHYASAGLSRKGDGSYYIRFRATQKTFAQLNEDASGWVYVFDKKFFTQRAIRKIEYMTTTPVVPIEKVRVTKGDLPENIEIFTDNSLRV